MRYLSAVSLIAVAVVVSATTVFAQQPTFSNKLLAYVRLFSISMVAQQNCPGIKVNFDRLASVYKSFGLQDEDTNAINQFVIGEEKNIEIEFNRKGRAKWCSNNWSELGPNGTVLSDTLKR